MAFSWRAMLSYPFRRVQATAKAVSNYDDHRRFIGQIQGVWRKMSTRPPKSQRQESFQNAYVRLGLTEERLAVTHKHYLFRFWLFSVAGAVGLGMLLYSVLTSDALSIRTWGDAGALLGSLGPIVGFMAICSAFAFDASFRLYQIERRELVNGLAWWRARESWIPAPFQPQAPVPHASRSASLRAVR